MLFPQVVLHWEKDLGALGMPLMPAMIAHQTSSTSAPSRQSSVGSTTIAAGGPSRLLGIKVNGLGDLNLSSCALRVFESFNAQL